MKKKLSILAVLLFSINTYSQLTEGFENTTGPDAFPSTNWTLGSGNWAVFDNGVGTQRWGINSTISTPASVYQGSNAAYVNRDNIGLGNTSENYLATPVVQIPTNGELHFFTRMFTSGNQGTIYQIKIAPATASQTDITAYSLVQQWTESELIVPTSNFNIYTEKVVNLSAFAGQFVYFSFVKVFTQPTASIDGDRWLIDSVSINSSCLAPTGLTFSAITTNGATLNWLNHNGTGTVSWEIEIVLATGSPTGVPTNTTTTLPFLVTGLLPNTTYNYYVRAICSTGFTSSWSTVSANFTTNPGCGGNFLDSGALGNYANNSNLANLICPSSPTDKVTVTFTTFDTESDTDILSIYNGNSAAAPLIGSYSGTNLPPSATSSAVNGCLYFVFTSNGSVTQTGWSSNISCAPAASCPNPLGVNSTTVVTNTSQLSWIEAGSATSWQVLTLPCGSPTPTNSTTGWISTSANPYIVNGLTPNCCNQYYVRSVCSGSETSTWTPAYLNQAGSYVVWNSASNSNSVSGTFTGGTVTVTQTGPGNAVSFNSPATFDTNVVVTGSNTFSTFGPTTNPPSRSLTFTFSTPVIIDRYNMADIDLGDSWNDTFNFGGVTFSSTTATDLSTTVTGAVATTETGNNAEYGSWFTSTSAVTSFSINYATTGGLTHAYLTYALKVFMPCTIPLATLNVSVNSPTVCQGTSANVIATPNTPGTYNYEWTVPTGATNPGNVASFSTYVAGTYSVIITDTTIGTTSLNSSGTVTINLPVAATFNAIPVICNGATAPSLPSTSIQGFLGTWSPAIIDNTQSASYTFTPNAGQCASNLIKYITVSQNIIPTFLSPAPICSGSPAPILPLTSLNGITGNWTPIVIGNTQTATYTFTPNTGQCALSATLTATITSNITPTFVLGTSINSCASTTQITLPISSQNGITGTWNPPILDYSTIGTTVYTFTPNTAQCALSTTLTATITSNLIPSFALGTSINSCASTTLITLPISSQNGITGTWNPTILDYSTIGTTVYIFTPNSYICAANAILTVVINPNITATFAQVNPICSGRQLNALPTTSIEGITGTWLPSLNNLATTIYTFTPTIGLCAITTSMTIVVNPIISPTFNAIAKLCPGETPPSLPTSSIEGITGIWTPTVVNNTTSGTYTFISNNGQCSTNGNLSITVQDAFDFAISGSCIGNNFILELKSLNNSIDLTTANFVWLNANNAVIGTNTNTFNVTEYLASTTIVETLPITFSVKVINPIGCYKTEPITLTRIFCGIQKGISVNNDGLNDFFDLTLLNVKHLSVFNRYGMKVYNKDGYTNEWVGQSDKGDDLPDGTYYYIIDFNDNLPVKTGWIYINREN